jgi:TM2 domain-containing membrane protein YozV
MTGYPQAANLGTEGQILFDANKKSKVVAYLLWFFLGALGAHRLYMRRIKSGLAQLAMWVGAMAIVIYAMSSVMAAVPVATTADGQPADPAAAEEAAVAAVQALGSDPTYLTGLALLGVFSIWWIVDAFLIPGWIRGHNSELAQSLAGR